MQNFLDSIVEAVETGANKINEALSSAEPLSRRSAGGRAAEVAGLTGGVVALAKNATGQDNIVLATFTTPGSYTTVTQEIKLNPSHQTLFSLTIHRPAQARPKDQISLKTMTALLDAYGIDCEHEALKELPEKLLNLAQRRHSYLQRVLSDPALRGKNGFSITHETLVELIKDSENMKDEAGRIMTDGSSLLTDPERAKRMNFILKMLQLAEHEPCVIDRDALSYVGGEKRVLLPDAITSNNALDKSTLARNNSTVERVFKPLREFEDKVAPTELLGVLSKAYKEYLADMQAAKLTVGSAEHTVAADRLVAIKKLGSELQATVRDGGSDQNAKLLYQVFRADKVPTRASFADQSVKISSSNSNARTQNGLTGQVDQSLIGRWQNKFAPSNILIEDQSKISLINGKGRPIQADFVLSGNQITMNGDTLTLSSDGKNLLNDMGKVIFYKK